MKRDAIKQLIDWKNSKRRKPLILQGARQVGKTWLMQEFGKREYKKTAYVTFDRNENLQKAFKDYTNVKELLTKLEIETQMKITPEDTLIIFDEIQECPDAITALKYFNEKSPEYHIIVAGSLLGLAHHNGTGFPVGKVNFMTLYPLNFLEFLSANGEELLREAIEAKKIDTVETFSSKLIDYLKYYYYVGGMPEVVQSFIDNRDFKEVREIQEEIISSYNEDFSKHTDSNTAERISMVWNSISSQLAKENKKFIYNAIRTGARAKDFEIALAWLRDSGLVYKITKISKPSLPIKAYENIDIFKLYILDVGLLGALSNLSATAILEENRIFTEFKGALTEQYVLQQLKINQNDIHYWTSKSNVAEIDFVTQVEDYVIPIEVKATTNLKAKSLQQYRKDYSPEISVRTSLAGFEINNRLYNIPLYLIGVFEKLVTKSSY